MNFSPVPDRKFEKITDITPEELRKMGISLLLMDLDNTISPYRVYEPTEKVKIWAEEMKNAGIKLFIVSNSKKVRPEIFSEKLGIPYLKRAKKPGVKAILAAVELEKCAKDEAALVGDQVYTDVLGANRAGVTSILVEPIKFTNPFLAVRYFFEFPFRHEKRK